MYSGSIAHPPLPHPLPLRKFPLNLYNSVIFKKRKKNKSFAAAQRREKGLSKESQKMYEEEEEADEDEDELKLKKFFHSLSISLY